MYVSKSPEWLFISDGNIEHTGFVHYAEYHAGLRFPVRGDLGPGLGEDRGRGTVLADDTAPPAAVVVDVDAGDSVSEVSWRRVKTVLGGASRSTHMQWVSALVSRQICTRALYFAK
jgi:hypothetical protein